MLCCIIGLGQVSCGGDGGAGFGGYSLAGGGVGGTGYSSGSVSSYGSIYSNGIHFDTRSAEIIIEGHSVGLGDGAAHDHLKLGQIVRVEGTINEDDSGAAQRVYYDKTMEGPCSDVEYLDPYTRLITILGQKIIIDNQTEYVDADLDSVFTEPGQVLEVSGFFDEQDVLFASYIAKKQGSDEVTVTGTVQSLDAGNRTFRLGDLTIDYGYVDTPMPELAEGEKVRVKGRFDADSSNIEAVELMDWHALDHRLEAEKIKIEGIVLEMNDADVSLPMEMKVDDVVIRIDENTVFKEIDSADDLISGMEVLVTGTLTNGILFADQVENKLDLIVTGGVVASMDDAQQTFIIDDSHQLVRISDVSAILGASGFLHFTDISEGDQVRIMGWIRPDNSITVRLVSDICGSDCWYLNKSHYSSLYWGSTVLGSGTQCR